MMIVNLEKKRKSQSPGTTWVIGGGKFGRRAVKLLHNATASMKFVVVDQQSVTDLPLDIEFVRADGVEWLAEQPLSDDFVTKIIPVIPVHLAAEWLKRKLTGEGAVVSPLTIPESLIDQLPHPIRLRADKIVISHADFICPDNCAEPDNICSYTQELRPPPLNKLLETMDCGDFTQIIIRSIQFAPGVGGFYLKDLYNALVRVKSLPDVPLLIGTACKCHGALDSFCFKDNQSMI